VARSIVALLRQPAKEPKFGERTMTKTRHLKDVMNPDIMTVGDDMTTDQLARFLIEREISGAPVVDSQGQLIGVVSMTDIGRNMAEPPDLGPGNSDFYRDDVADLSLEDLGQRYVDERAVTVRDVMTPVIHQVPVNASVADAARVMVQQHIHRLVVTQGKDPVGIITSMDLLKLLADQL
jgi:predicted transcriptional regulator